MSALEIELCDADEVGPEWDALAERTAASPFVRRGWVQAWQDAFGRRRVVLLTARHAGALVGAIPLQLRYGVLSSPTNWHSPEFTLLAESDQVRGTLLEALVSRNGRWLQLSFVDHDLAREIEALASVTRGQQSLSRVVERGPYIDLSGSFEHFAAGLSSHMRSEMRRKRRRLGDLGEVTLQVHEKADVDALEEFFRIEATGWKGSQGTAIDRNPATRRFYQDVARWTADEGWFRLALLRVGDRTVAGDFSVQHNGVAYILKTGFDTDLRRFSPGKLLRMEMVKRAFADGLSRYELLGVEDAWKLEWTSLARDRLVVQVFAPTYSGRVDRLAFRYGRPAAKAVLDAAAPRSSTTGRRSWRGRSAVSPRRGASGR